MKKEPYVETQGDAFIFQISGYQTFALLILAPYIYMNAKTILGTANHMFNKPNAVNEIEIHPTATGLSFASLPID